MPTNTYTALATLTLASAQSTVTFGSIPATGYRDLVLVTSVATQSDSFRQYRMRLNGDSGANYSQVRMDGNGSSTGSSGDSSATEMLFFSTGTGSTFATMITQFMDYSATDKHKTLLHRSNTPDATVGAQAARWSNTAAISSIAIYTPAGQFVAGSTFSLYGIAG